jgi:hypothetical protein
MTSSCYLVTDNECVLCSLVGLRRDDDARGFYPLYFAVQVVASWVCIRQPVQQVNKRLSTILWY